MSRTAKVSRKTKETDIEVEVNLDGSGIYDIDVEGVGFLVHMLEQLSRHGKFDIKIKARGDIYIDYHHITEDVGIVLGEAFAKALGDKKTIQRFAHAYVTMDEALSRSAIDLSGRPYLVWNVKFSQEKLGNFDTELFKEFFQAFTNLLKANIHIENLYGSNNHHIIESCFKALALSLRQAVSLGKNLDLPSTKGII